MPKNDPIDDTGEETSPLPDSTITVECSFCGAELELHYNAAPHEGGIPLLFECPVASCSSNGALQKAPLPEHRQVTSTDSGRSRAGNR
jgi:hypothetical protein